MDAHRSEELRVKKSHAKRTIASHGDSANAARLAARGNPVAILDPRHEFLPEEIVIAEARVMRVHEEAGITSRTDNDEIAQFVAIPKLLDQIEGSGTHEHLLVIAKPVEIIEHGITTIGVFPVTGREDHTVRNGMPQDAAGHSPAFPTRRRRWEWSGRRKQSHRRQAAHTEDNQCGSDKVRL